MQHEGRIKGLCLAKYEKTLADCLKSQDPKLDPEKCLSGIRSGIEHLHELGLVHNDINPTNIMFRLDYTPVIIDFDSCEKEGSVPEFKTGTPGWDDMDATTARRENDLGALEKLTNALRAVQP